MREDGLLQWRPEAREGGGGWLAYGARVPASRQSFAIFGEWVTGGEESSASSSDESNKKFTTRIGSSSNTCLMANGMDSDLSDDDSDSPSIDELNLVYEHQKVIKKQSKQITNFNVLNDFNASLATNYDDFVKLVAAGLLIGVECSRENDSAWMYLTSVVTTRIGVELAAVQGNYPIML